MAKIPAFQRAGADRPGACDRVGWDGSSAGARIQREAVAAIEDVGGILYYDWKWTNSAGIPGASPPAPRWLAEFVGVDYFGHVAAVWFPGGSKATVAALAQSGRLTRLEFLNLAGFPMSDRELPYLKGLTNVSRLDPQRHSCHRRRIGSPRGATNLSTLALTDSRADDAGLAI